MKTMQEYIVKGKEIFIGLEDSKRTWKISARCEKIEVHYISIPAVYSVFKSYLRKHYPNCKITVIYEAGFKGFELHDKLVLDGWNSVVTPPNKVTEEKDSRVKTDKIDCRRLAKNLENGDFKSCFVPDQEQRSDRQISRTLVAIQKDITRVRNRMRKFLDFHGLGQNLPAGTWNHTHYRLLMEMELEGALGISLTIYKEQLKHLMEFKLRLKRELQKLSKKQRYAATFKIFESAPGIGWLTAIRLILEWGEDLSHFKSGKHLSSFIGLTSSEYSTGETVRKGRITGQGHTFVRSWLIQCAWTAVKRDSVLLEKYTRVWHNSGSKKKAIVAVARKLSVRLWRCAINKEPYVNGLVALV
jgi:transposase